MHTNMHTHARTHIHTHAHTHTHSYTHTHTHNTHTHTCTPSKQTQLQYGLFSAFMGCFVYVFFGTSKDVTLGPTAIVSLLTASLTYDCGPDLEDYDSRIPCAVALTFFSGVIQLFLGVLNLGTLFKLTARNLYIYKTDCKKICLIVSTTSLSSKLELMLLVWLGSSHDTN